MFTNKLKHLTLSLLILIFISSNVVKSQDSKCPCELEEFADPLPRIVHIDPKSHQFVDEFGRTSWFRGTNVVSKSWPYHPHIGGPDVCNHTFDTPLCDDDMDYLQELGINLVRLGVMWGGAEPTRGEYNCSYFCVIHEIIRSLAQRGIYTLVDVHQDVLARQFCQEGVPDWFVQKDWITNESHRFPYPQAQPFTVDEIGIPSPISQCWGIGADWFLSYFSFAVSDAFERFYQNHDGLLDSFAAYWHKIASEFKDYSSVLGYNLLNEPWAGGIYSSPDLLIPGVADKKNLENAWNVTSAKIREVDTSTIIFFEGVTWDVISGFSPLSLNDAPKTALSYHYYSPPQLGLHLMFINRLRDLEHLGIGGMLTEFRAWAAEGDEDHEEIDGLMRSTVEAADKYLQSWIGWGYRSIQDRSASVALHYARTYASAVAGTTVESAFNEDTAEFRLSWIINTDISQPSEIKLSKKLYYPFGFEVMTQPQGWFNISETSNGFHIMYNSVTRNEYAASILVFPKPFADSTTTDSSTDSSPTNSDPTSSSSTSTDSSTTPSSGSANLVTTSSWKQKAAISFTILLYLRFNI